MGAAFGDRLGSGGVPAAAIGRFGWIPVGVVGGVPVGGVPVGVSVGVPPGVPVGGVPVGGVPVGVPVVVLGAGGTVLRKYQLSDVPFVTPPLAR
jgi:hypothetical protein